MAHEQISSTLVAKFNALAKEQSSFERYEEYCNITGSRIEYDSWLEDQTSGDMNELLEIGQQDAEIEMAREILKDIQDLKKHFEKIRSAYASVKESPKMIEKKKKMLKNI